MPVTAPPPPAAVRAVHRAGLRSARRTAAQLLLAAAAVLGLLLSGASPAAAHAALTASTPEDGAVTDSAPERVTLTFSESVSLSDESIRVFDPDGRRVDAGEPKALGGGAARYGVELRPGLPEGTFTVAWQVVSTDSHPISGAFTFAVGAPSETTAAIPEQEAGGGLVGLLYDIARYAAYAGFVLLTGGAAFVLVCWPRGTGVRAVQRLVVRSWVTLTAATLALLLLRTPYTGSGELADAFDLAGLRDVLETKTGGALLSRLLLLAAAALFVGVLFGTYGRRLAASGGGDDGDGRSDEDGDGDGSGHGAGDGHGGGHGAGDGDGEEKRTGDPASGDGGDRRDLFRGLAIGGLVVSAGLAGTWAMSEHASSGIQPQLAMPVDVLHLLAVAAWLGGLTALLVALYRGPAVEREAVRRFSRIAFGSVIVLVLTGLYQSWRQVGSWEPLVSTAYGRLLLAKITLVLLMVALARYSRRWTGRLADRAGSTGGEEPVTGDQAPGGHAPGDPAPGGAPAADGPTDDTHAGAPGAPGAPSAPGDPARAAQLARQRAALATAREKRARDADPGRTGLRRSVLAEAAVAVLVLAVTTALTGSEPARTEDAAAARSATGASATTPHRPVALDIPFDTGGENGQGNAFLDVDPGFAGDNTVHLRTEHKDGAPLGAPEVKLSFTLPDKDLGPISVPLKRITPDHWYATDVRLPMAGAWELSLTVRTSDIDQVTETRNVKIG